MATGEKVFLGNIKGPKGDPGDISLAIALTQKGAANGVATLDGSAHVPASQLANAILATALGVANGAASLDSGGHIPSGQIPAIFVPTASEGIANGVATLDSGGQVPTSQLGNVPPQSQPGQFLPEDYGAYGQAKLATDVATNGTQTFTSSQIAANASIGMYVMIGGARGNTDTDAIGVITAIVGSTVTITSVNGIAVTATGLFAWYGHDDTAAINAALAAAKSYAEANDYDAEVLLTQGPYIVATNTQSDNGTALYNTAIKIPYPSNNNVRKLTIGLKGVRRADATQYWNQSVPNALSSAIIAMTKAPSTLDVTYGPQSVIGTPDASPGGGMAGSISPTFVNVYPVIENVAVITPMFTNLTAFDFTRACGVYMDGCSAHANAVTVVGNGTHLLDAWSGVTLDNTLGHGLRLPTGGNNANTYIPSMVIEGYATGVFTPSEHTRIDRITILYTSVALSVLGTGTGHGLSIGHVSAEGYKGGIQLRGGGGGKVPIFIESWSTETSGSIYDISDPGNAFQGIVNWYNNVDARDIIVSGAANLTITVPTIYRKVPRVVTLTDGSTVAIDARDGNVYEWPLGANSHTLANPSNPVSGQIITIDISYSGSFTPNFGTAFAFGTDGTPTWTSVSGKVDTISFRYHAGKAKWLCQGWKLGY